MEDQDLDTVLNIISNIGELSVKNIWFGIGFVLLIIVGIILWKIVLSNQEWKEKVKKAIQEINKTKKQKDEIDNNVKNGDDWEN